ncbi:hypothetical protein [Streptomyces sp. NPDC003710]
MSTLIARRTAAAALGLAACSNPSDGGTTEAAATKGGKTKIDISPDQNRITTGKVDSIAAKVLRRWGLSDEAVAKSEINPPGLPKTNK